ncbi:unnamed protein product [Effrenium voratum]|nr:unnamed protein product [Effrenium voratum]
MRVLALAGANLVLGDWRAWESAHWSLGLPLQEVAGCRCTGPWADFQHVLNFTLTHTPDSALARARLCRAGADLARQVLGDFRAAAWRWTKTTATGDSEWLDFGSSDRWCPAGLTAALGVCAAVHAEALEAPGTEIEPAGEVDWHSALGFWPSLLPEDCEQHLTCLAYLEALLALATLRHCAPCLEESMWPMTVEEVNDNAVRFLRYLWLRGAESPPPPWQGSLAGASRRFKAAPPLEAGARRHGPAQPLSRSGVEALRPLALSPALLGERQAIGWRILILLPCVLGQSTLKLSATLTIEKSDDKAKTNEQVIQLLAHAKEKKYEGNVQRFLENMVNQLQKVMDAAKAVEEKKSTETPKDFTPAKYRIKAMPKLNAKKITVKKMTAADLAKRLDEGQDINFKEPMLITNATALFEPGAWDEVRRHWTASRLMEDPDLEKDFRIEYWPQEKARARLVGNQLQMEEPEMIPFSRYLVNCFHGTPAKPKLPGQNTEHCEQTVDAQTMVRNLTELEQLRIFRKIENALPHMAEFRRHLLEAAGDELKAIVGKGAERWKRNQGRLSYQYFTFGPSGSGANLRPENGLPFFDVLVHGSKRWLLLQEDEMERVAQKAREARAPVGQHEGQALAVTRTRPKEFVCQMPTPPDLTMPRRTLLVPAQPPGKPAQSLEQRLADLLAVIPTSTPSPSPLPAEPPPPEPAEPVPAKRSLLAPCRAEAPGNEGLDACYRVTFTKDVHKKRKVYQCGFLRIKAGKAFLYNDEGKTVLLGRSLRVEKPLQPGAELATYQAVVEVEQDLAVADFESGRAFTQPALAALAPTDHAEAAKAPKAKKRRQALLCEGDEEPAPPEAAPPGALVLDESGTMFLDHFLASRLKPHQEEGVKFMTQHLLAEGGCILADSMGLGKTLQAICTLWVAFHKPAGRPISKKAAVVCPSSLCGNWEAEVSRWLGFRLRPVVVGTEPAKQVRTFLRSTGTLDGRLLIISYDQLRLHAEALDGALDLLICDEGHRLKSAGTATAKRLEALRCRRILLTGTPLQNNLDEFYCCCHFVQPTKMPSPQVFQRVFKGPIDRARDEAASAEERQLGRNRSAELLRLTSGFILRRGPEILEAMLPSRTELLLTVALAPAQVEAYRGLLALRWAGQQLGLLQLLRQLCNDPGGLLTSFEKKSAAPSFSSARVAFADEEEAPISLLPDFATGCKEVVQRALGRSCGVPSAKLELLEGLLSHLQSEAPEDGVVIVSNFVSMLSCCSALCKGLGFKVSHLDGSTAVQKRQALVDNFNQQRGPKAFLLSAKAGGVGLNVTGANRMLLLEPDWNPAVDLQAMGRVWRQGQTKPVTIYRLATLGTLEEKILKRQAHKQGLASLVSAGNLQSSDVKELYKVFTLDGYTAEGRPQPSERRSAESGAEFGLPRLPGLQGAERLTRPAVEAEETVVETSEELKECNDAPLFLRYQS